MDAYEIQNGTAGQRARADELVRLAYAAFEGSLPDGRALLPGEVKMLRGAAMGEWVDLANGVDDEKLRWDFANNVGSEWGCWHSWRPDRRVRAVVLRWVCSSQRAHVLVDPFGLLLSNAWIMGALDLDSVSVPFRIGFFHCALPDPMTAAGSGLKALVLRGSCVHSFRAARASIAGNLEFGDQFRSLGEVWLNGAKIGADLRCGGSRFERSNGLSLVAEGLQVSGSAFFTPNFYVAGEMTLRDAKIGGILQFTGARLDGAKGQSLSADRMQVSGALYLNEGFVASGSVRLQGVSVGGNLECSGGRFESSDDGSLIAERVQVDGNIHFRDGFHAIGEVRLVGAQIGGNLDCAGGIFEGCDGQSIIAEGIQVAGSVVLRGGFNASGNVRFPGAVIGGALHCTNGHFGSDLNLTMLELKGPFFFNPEEEIGSIDLTGARVGVLVDELSAWPNILRLTDFEYGRIHFDSIRKLPERLAWLANHDATCISSDRFDPQPYRQLAKVLRHSGHTQFADAVMFEASKRQAESQLQRLKEQGRSWVNVVFVVWYWLLENLIGYGYRRWLPLAWMLMFFLIGAIVFSDGDPKDLVWFSDPYPGGMQPTQAKAIADAGLPWVAEYPVFRPIAYSMDTFLPLVDLHQEKYWTPKDGLVKRVYLPFHILMGWVVTTLAAVSVTGLVRHEKE